MTAKVFVTTTAGSVHQVGGTWWDVEDAASDIQGGDFWSEVEKLFPDGGVSIAKIEIVPDQPIELKWGE